jgi:CDGSH-type Zn-finger protein
LSIGAITYERHDGGPQESAPRVNVVRVRENGPYAVHAQIESDVAKFRVTLCRCGKSNRKPYCDGSHTATEFAATGEPATIASEPLGERGGRLTITPTLRSPAAERQRRNLQRHRTNGVADPIGAARLLWRF